MNRSTRTVNLLARSILEIREAPCLWPEEVTTNAERGIIISACGRLLPHLYANLRIIRGVGFTEEIEIWHLPGEFTQAQIEFLSPLASFREDDTSPFNGLTGCHEVHGFKAWALAKSRFRKTLLLDVNCFPLRPLESIFDSGEPCIIWQDGPWMGYHRLMAKLRRSLSTTFHNCEFESGELFVDLSRPEIRLALRFAAALNSLGPKLYRYTYGDKETYALAFDLLGVPFTLAPTPIVYPDASVVECGGVLQPGLDGASLFYHPMFAKDRWWEFKPEWAELHKTSEIAAAKFGVA